MLHTVCQVTFVENILPGPKCIPNTSILDATPSYKSSTMGSYFGHQVILEDGCENNDVGGRANYYLVDNGKVNAFIILDLGCDVFVSNVQLRNAHNVNYE